MKDRKPRSAETDEIVTAYTDLHPLYQRFCTKVKGLLEDLLAASNIRYQVVEARAKTVESFAEKIQREGKSYENPLVDISDLEAPPIGE